MTETTSIQQFTRERRTYAPVVRQPGLATFMGQAAFGSFCGSFVVLLVRVLIPYNSHGYYVFYLPYLMALGLATGAVAGLLIWAATKEADGPLLGITRTLLSVLVVALAWFGLWYYWLRKEEFSSETHMWMLAGVVASGVSIGLLTGSRLRLGRELVRGGETKERVLRILAGLNGFALRSVVGFLFLCFLIAAISSLQLYYRHPDPTFPHLPRSLIWHLVLLGHFASGTVILFARMRFWLLVLLTVISTAPVVASLWLARLNPPEDYIIIGYLGVWVMFLVTRWRQTDVAVRVVKEELRYYLID